MHRVFVIEDDPLMRELIVRSLGRGEVEVTSFGDAADAVDPIIVEQPDLIISDVNMPRMSGLDLVRRLRAHAVRVPVILVTAEASEEVMDEARALGVVRIFKKPLGDPSRLWMAVESELTGQGADTLEALDTLRLELLTDLSHQIRTPLTATKLAMEGLFEQMDDSMDAPQKRLADISRRNIDRLVALIENQLEALQRRVRGRKERVNEGERDADVVPLLGATPPGGRFRQ